MVRPRPSGGAGHLPRSRLLLAVGAVVVLCLVSGVVGALVVTSGALGAAGLPLRLNLKSNSDINLHGAHIRLVGDDGNFEFEHSKTQPVARFNSYVLGTGRRTPIGVGVADGQDIVELIVRGTGPRKQDMVAGGGRSAVGLSPQSTPKGACASGRRRFVTCLRASRAAAASSAVRSSRVSKTVPTAASVLARRALRPSRIATALRCPAGSESGSTPRSLARSEPRQLSCRHEPRLERTDFMTSGEPVNGGEPGSMATRAGHSYPRPPLRASGQAAGKRTAQLHHIRRLYCARRLRGIRRRHGATAAETCGGSDDRRLADAARPRRSQRPSPCGQGPRLISEHIRCNNKGFQIRHLELLSRGDTWSGSPSSSAAGPCGTRPTFTSSL